MLHNRESGQDEEAEAEEQRSDVHPPRIGKRAQGLGNAVGKLAQAVEDCDGADEDDEELEEKISGLKSAITEAAPYWHPNKSTNEDESWEDNSNLMNDARARVTELEQALKRKKEAEAAEKQGLLPSNPATMFGHK